MIMAKIHVHYKRYLLGRIGLLHEVSESNYCGCYTGVFISRTAELFQQITEMLSEKAVFMVYLQLREFRLPARGCS